MEPITDLEYEPSVGVDWQSRRQVVARLVVPADVVFIRPVYECQRLWKHHLHSKRTTRVVLRSLVMTLMWMTEMVTPVRVEETVWVDVVVVVVRMDWKWPRFD